MTILWINLAIVFILSFFSRYFAVDTTGTMSSIPLKPNKFLTIAVILSFVLVSGLRNNIGDTYFYAHDYKMFHYTWDLIKTQKDYGFGVYQMLLQKFSNNPQILIFTSALIMNLLIISVFYNYSRIFELSTYVFITGGLFIVTMNGMRQCIAAAIVFTATKFLIDGSWRKYLLIVLFASTFHQSALILIPIYFLSRVKAWSKATFLLLFFSVLIVIGFNQFSSILFSAIQDTQYSEYKSFSEGGANIIRVIVYAIPIVIAYFGKEKLREIFPESDYIVNMAIIGLVFMIISTQNWIFARFNIYFNLYQIILISWVVKVFKEKDQRLIYYLIIVCYFLYNYYESAISLNIIYKSDYF